MVNPREKKPARILIVDDHPVVRLGIRQAISTDPRLTVTAEAESADEALDAIRRTPVDLVIVDLSLKSGAGLSLIRALREVSPDLPVLVLSMHDEVLFAERAIKAGARGYIMKQEAIDGLVGAIHRVLSGAIYLSESMSQRMLERVSRDMRSTSARPSRGDLELLSNRELEVLELIGRGFNTAEIADRLNVSVKTVETYKANLKTKLNLKDSSELIRFAASWTEHL